MLKTPKSLRLQIGLFGRTNVGKSAFLNHITRQNVSITSSVAGTTTDVVEKAVELLPIGPVLFLDTAGIDDNTYLSKLRFKKTKNIFSRSDIFVLIVEAGIWTDYEENIIKESLKQKTPVIIIINKSDIKKPDDKFINKIKQKTSHYIVLSSVDKSNQDFNVHEFKSKLIEIVPKDFLNPPSIAGNLIRKNGILMLIIPIDKEAPKGRVILPQVQTLRDALDYNKISIVLKDTEYKLALKKLNLKPDLVVCDSQIIRKVADETPDDVPFTTFSILFARIKGNLPDMVKDAVLAVKKLKDKDKILIAESCSHHPIEDDIGRVKIPRWLKKYTGKNLIFESCAGRDFPENIESYKLIIQCGGCMITRREMLSRIEKAKSHGIPMTNYGVCICLTQGVLKKVLSVFPEIPQDILKIL